MSYEYELHLEVECDILRGLLREAIPYVMDAFPQRGHVGGCGPEAGCDATCMEAANISDFLRRIHKTLDKL